MRLYRILTARRCTFRPRLMLDFVYWRSNISIAISRSRRWRDGNPLSISQKVFVYNKCAFFFCSSASCLSFFVTNRIEFASQFTRSIPAITISIPPFACELFSLRVHFSGGLGRFTRLRRPSICRVAYARSFALGRRV